MIDERLPAKEKRRAKSAKQEKIRQLMELEKLAGTLLLYHHEGLFVDTRHYLRQARSAASRELAREGWVASEGASGVRKKMAEGKRTTRAAREQVG